MARGLRQVLRLRVLLGAAGGALGGYGVYRLYAQEPHDKMLMLLVWLAAAVIIHDGVLSPVVIAVGWVISRAVPPRARRYLQAALISGALITIVAVPLIYRRGSQPTSKAILLQDYGGHLGLLLGIVGAVSLLAYAVHVAYDAGRSQPR
jgi:hypothetical protein